MNLLICDDESSVLEHMVNKASNSKATVFSATSSAEALRIIQKEVIDAAIFDIDIDEKSGIELAKIFNKIHPKGLVVFITSYASYAFDAFQVEAIKYLIKPIKEEAFESLLDYLKIKVEEQMFIENHMSKTISIKVSGIQILLKQSEIIYIEKVGKKVIFHTNHESYEVRETIKDIYELLSAELFLKCHQGFIINIDQIYKLERYTVYVGDQKSPVPVSKANVEQVQSAIKRKLWGE